LLEVARDLGADLPDVSSDTKKVGKKSEKRQQSWTQRKSTRNRKKEMHLPGLGQRLGVIEVAERNKGLVTLQARTKAARKEGKGQKKVRIARVRRAQDGL
jgi:hypothetical protein